MKPPLSRPKPKPKSQPSAPWQLPPTESGDVFALQALAKGIANEGQQKRAWNYIFHALCETERMTFWPGGEEGRRASDFANGKQWVGIQMRRIARMRAEMKDATGVPIGVPPSQENAT